MPNTDPHTAQFVRPCQLARILGVSPATIRRLEQRDPHFPPPYRNGRTVLHHVPTVVAYLADPHGPSVARGDQAGADVVEVPDEELPEFLRPRTRKVA